ncbi:MAG: AMP-binding protein [Acidimicrobiales bacterium]|nr:AMP-binding protein [Acidimicrobiales bacterium]
MTDLTALALPAGESFVTALRGEWERGAAIAPIDLRLPEAERNLLVAELAPTHVVEEDGERRKLPGGRPVESGDAVVVATSGSTGGPKGVVLTQSAVAASAQITSEALMVDPTADRWLCCLPVSHIGGLSVVTRALLTDTPLEIHDRFDADRVMNSVVSCGVTRISLVTRALAQVDPAAFTTILLGGASPPAHRPANVIATYGSTETGSGIVYERRSLAGVELRTDSDGQLWVRSPTLFRCYRDGSDPKDAQGWHPTGDAGSVSADGVLTVSGRMADVIVTGGEKVWPARIEPLIAALPGVAGVAVVGREHPEWGHEVVAVVEPIGGAEQPSLDRIREAVTATLPHWWAPKRLELVEALPRTPLGKIRRNQL